MIKSVSLLPKVFLMQVRASFASTLRHDFTTLVQSAKGPARGEDAVQGKRQRTCARPVKSARIAARKFELNI
jgi:hypothetical protein